MKYLYFAKVFLTDFVTETLPICIVVGLVTWWYAWPYVAGIMEMAR